MKLFAPLYYNDFKCTADRCRHSCCIGWEIDVDDKTIKKYATLSGAYAEEIRESVERAGTPHFRLGAGERCPHLDEKGLCRIITAYGDEMLCDICREHPRFYHETKRGREVGLGLSCEEACRLILTSDAFGEIKEIGEVVGEPPSPSFDVLPERARIFSLLADGTLSYKKRLSVLARAFGVSLSVNSDRAWREILDSLEYLDDAHRALFASFSFKKKRDKKAEPFLLRALAYFIYRHVSGAENEDELRSAIGFSLFCERLLASMVRAGGDVFNCARILSEELEYSEENTEIIKNEFLFY